MGRVVGIGVVGALVGVLGLGVTGAGAQSVPDPCALLKPVEIEKVMGQAPTPADEGAAYADQRQCYWNLEGAGAAPAGSVGTVLIVGAAAKPTFQGNKQALGAKPVKGIKTSYYEVEGSTVAVLRGDTLLLVQVLLYGDDGTPIDADKKDVVKLTKTALRRLTQ